MAWRVITISLFRFRSKWRIQLNVVSIPRSIVIKCEIRKSPRSWALRKGDLPWARAVSFPNASVLATDTRSFHLCSVHLCIALSSFLLRTDLRQTWARVPSPIRITNDWNARRTFKLISVSFRGIFKNRNIFFGALRTMRPIIILLRKWKDGYIATVYWCCCESYDQKISVSCFHRKKNVFSVGSQRTHLKCWRSDECCGHVACVKKGGGGGWRECSDT